ncbi:MAG: 3-isopropylmalate dehydrogenase [Tepidanaerobacteraceae bacterium]|nr:3-isopropylmalate dehydrogenase [Tepidanaerobacteraceae bacterium]
MLERRKTAMYKIAVLAGDGIGPEVMAEAVKVLRAVEKKFGLEFEFREGLAGGAAIDVHGMPLPESTVKLCGECDAVLFGAVGGPKWDGVESRLRPERAILGLRKHFGLYANLRPAVLFPPLIDASPLKREIVEELDLLIVRELTGGLYFGTPKGRDESGGKVRAFDTMTYTEHEIERVAHIAFKAAQKRRKRVTSVDKANVLETSRLWREVVEKVAAAYPDVELFHMYVDNCSMQMVINPGQFDVILTENTFGDILSDESAVLTGSIGMLPSASLGDKQPYLYEPTHGSAPDIAGSGRANPIACILSASMMLEYSFGASDAASAIKQAVTRALNGGYRTADIYSGKGRLVSTAEMGDIVVDYI